MNLQVTFPTDLPSDMKLYRVKYFNGAYEWLHSKFCRHPYLSFLFHNRFVEWWASHTEVEIDLVEEMGRAIRDDIDYQIMQELRDEYSKLNQANIDAADN